MSAMTVSLPIGAIAFSSKHKTFVKVTAKEGKKYVVSRLLGPDGRRLPGVVPDRSLRRASGLEPRPGTVRLTRDEPYHVQVRRLLAASVQTLS